MWYRSPKKTEIETNTDPSPPSYDSLSSSSSTRDADIERLWATAINSPSHCRCGTKCTRNSCSKFPQLFFGFQSPVLQTFPSSSSPRPLFTSQPAPPMWRAVLHVWNRNVPGLMRSGFNWTASNISSLSDYSTINGHHCGTIAMPPTAKDQRVETLLSPDFASSWGQSSSHWHHVRRYSLQGTTGAGPWVGYLHIFTNDYSTHLKSNVYEFITADSTAWGWAVDAEGQTVFDTRAGPDKSVNVVYSGLMRWWTCPGDRHSSDRGR